MSDVLAPVAGVVLPMVLFALGVLAASPVCDRVLCWIVRRSGGRPVRW